jgi:hypothetical protein
MERWIRIRSFIILGCPKLDLERESTNSLPIYEREALTGSETGVLVVVNHRLLREYFEDASIHPQTIALFLWIYSWFRSSTSGMHDRIDKLFEEYAIKAIGEKPIIFLCLFAKSKKFKRSS